MDMERYWKDRVAREGRQAIVTPGTDYEKRTNEEVGYLVRKIQAAFAHRKGKRVARSIEYGAGHGRLLAVQATTSEAPEFLDLTEQNRELFYEVHGREAYPFEIARISEVKLSKVYDYALTWTVLQHIVDDGEFDASVRAIVESVDTLGFVFTYEATNDNGKITSSHCSHRSEGRFLLPFLRKCVLVEFEEFYPAGMGIHNPPTHKFYTFRRMVP